MVADNKEAEKDYMAGMKYRDIAEKYGVTINTVKSWKKRYSWDRKEGAYKTEKGCTQIQKGVHTNLEKGAHKKTASFTEEVIVDDGTRETLQNDELTTEQRLFCVFYIKSFNATMSYMKAYRCSYESAMSAGSRLLRNVKVKEEINRLQEIKRQQVVCTEDDLVELHMRIAGADIGDYLEFGQEEQLVMSLHGPVEIKGTDGKKHRLTKKVNVVKLKESAELDTQLIQEVKSGKNGVGIKLADKQKSMDWLDRHLGYNTSDRQRQAIETQRLELEYLKLEAATRAGDTGDEEVVQDNFIEMLNASAKEVWADERSERAGQDKGENTGQN